MKQTPDEQKVQHKLSAGAISQGGFLGTDHRCVADIVNADKAALDQLGLNCVEVGERLTEIMREAMAAQGAEVEVGKHLRARYCEAMGKIPSPWSDGMFPKGEVELTDTQDGTMVRFSPLSVHLITSHCFFQGKGARYRLDPAHVSRMIGLVSR